MGKYEEALERAKQGMPIDEVFPELKESKDERIRKWLIDYFKKVGKSWLHQDISPEQILAYLEKQKTSEEAIRYVKENHSPDEVSDFQAAMNIAVAKAYDKGVQDTLEKQKEQKPSELERLDKLREMTKEIREAYERGVEVGKLYEQKPAEWKPLPESMEALLLAIEGKWDAIKPTGYMSRRLEDLYEGLVNTFNIDEYYLNSLPKTEYTEKDIEEIKALKGKIDSSMETKPEEWSEEDEMMFTSIVDTLVLTNGAAQMKINWLKRLKDRVLIQSKSAEWSEEDKDKVDDICKLIEHATIIPRSGDDDTGTPPTRLNDKYKGELKTFVKSLRPHWKPSEEQMIAFQNSVEHIPHAYYEDMWKLYEQLKKLK